MVFRWNLNEMRIIIQRLFIQKMPLKMLSTKSWPFCSNPNLIHSQTYKASVLDTCLTNSVMEIRGSREFLTLLFPEPPGNVSAMLDTRLCVIWTFCSLVIILYNDPCRTQPENIQSYKKYYWCTEFFFWENIKMYLHYHFLTLGRCKKLKYFLWNMKYHLSYGQYHGCWWPGDTRSQVISSQVIDIILQECSGFNTRRQMW